ncbi:MAG TPA: glycoside hydrolase family 13 [Desulfurivibrio alkaliphilus]|uniref:Glycoside hydrolase family 13 n=1 Tax=Desulfurivibrio alkaliphilus TaxID=427923 RepID=A0A7C2TH58_9BACT|nr:glycoside hydrolase family 13 [Desulfurivibrio alkaliphilus]
MAGKVCKSKSGGCAQKAAPAPSRAHEFSLNAPDADEVYLVGDFNNWENGKGKMRKLKSGLHKKSLKLKPGRYEYRFVVDGQWWTDPNNSLRCPNAFGEENSVIEIS